MIVMRLMVVVIDVLCRIRLARRGFVRIRDVVMGMILLKVSV